MASLKKLRNISIVHLFACCVIIVSAIANIRYGLTLGSTGFEKALYAVMSGASDGFKAFCLPLLLAAFVTRNYLRATAIILFLPLVVMYSWVSAIGFASTSTDRSIGDRQHQIELRRLINQTLSDARSKLKKLDKFPESRPLDIVKAELDNPPIDRRIWIRTKRCSDVTLQESVIACKKYDDLKFEHALARERLRLGNIINEHSLKLETLGPLDAVTGDPTSENIKVYVAAFGFTGLETPQIRAWLSFLVMGLLEVGSLTGLLIADGMKDRSRNPKSRSEVCKKSIPVPVHVPTRNSHKNGTPNGTEQKALKALKQAGGILHGTQLGLCKQLGIPSKTTLHRTLHKLADRGAIALETHRRNGTQIRLLTANSA